MDKQMYKQLISDLMRTESDLKSELEIIWDAVRNNPNNMKLGKVIRNMFWNRDDNIIYESPDGGNTIYSRKSGQTDRELIKSPNDNSNQLNLFE